MLLACCPLGLAIRIGQGSKFHMVALIGLAVGAAIFGHLRAPIVGTMSQLTLAPKKSPTSEASPNGANLSSAIRFSLATVDGGRISYGPGGEEMQFRHEQIGHPTSIVREPILLVYVAPPC